MSCQRAIESYSNQDPSFVGTREHKFLVSIAEAFDAGDSEGFTAAVAEYDRYATQIPISGSSRRHPSACRGLLRAST